jgi:hypothetical protein
MKALPLLKHNIDTLLHARRQTRRDLAQWVRQSMNNKIIDPWISHIFNTPDAEIQTKYLDRIADFFGVSVYQLFQPGISHLTERRKSERRSGKDRRLSAMNGRVRQTLAEAVAGLTADDVADVIRLKRLGTEARSGVRRRIETLERSEQQALRRKHRGHAAGTASTEARGRVDRSKKNLADHDGTEG